MVDEKTEVEELTEIQEKDALAREFLSAMKFTFKKLANTPNMADAEFYRIMKLPMFQDYYQTFKIIWRENVMPLKIKIEDLENNLKEMEIESEKN